ncbi:hypothetical protein [Kineosporia babensis]|uniref:Camelysin metallo-endopeptidase n=1 Tax=Kineosporia babensis TaxID=499548 RepID=A0A9X1NCJ3_9ACTN|nr:hypothetical protein [Kineosporia babensis]MCD5311269.1 hypothetical protein [Kineosporia babensis]
MRVLRQHLAVPAAITTGLVASGMMVWHTSYAAFSASSTVGGNTFEAAQVDVNANMVGVSNFSATNMAPGHPETECVVVTYTGGVDSTVTLSVKYPSGNNDLGQYLNFKIEEVDTAGGCAGASQTGANEILPGATTLDEKVSQSTGDGTTISWNAASNNSTKRYRFTADVAANANAAQGKTAGAEFVWTAKSNPA